MTREKLRDLVRHALREHVWNTAVGFGWLRHVEIELPRHEAIPTIQITARVTSEIFDAGPPGKPAGGPLPTDDERNRMRYDAERALLRELDARGPVGFRFSVFVVEHPDEWRPTLDEVVPDSWWPRRST